MHMDTSSDDLGEIKEARMASRRAINLMMANIKKRQTKKVWLPAGDQAYMYHSNIKPKDSPRAVKVKMH